MQYSDLVKRIAGDGADAWKTHYAASVARSTAAKTSSFSASAIRISTRPQPVIDRAVERMRGGDTHYTPVAGREALREAIAQAHARRTGQPVERGQRHFPCRGAERACSRPRCASRVPATRCSPSSRSIPPIRPPSRRRAPRMVRVPVRPGSGFRPDLAALEAAITPRSRAIFFATPNNPSGHVMSAADLAVIGELARRHALWIVVDEVYAGPRARRPRAEPCRESARASGHGGKPVEDARHARLARRLDGRPESADRPCRGARDRDALRPARLRAGGGAHRDRHRARSRVAHARLLPRALRVRARVAGADAGTRSACRPMPACSC